ncbi:hypothetical protein DERP_002631 [Dermatophagoides pteronyssinus]|uniref:Uncharacterized protein n=1 Tax=Dermatophagoides pteronyssinus TaxID=6956 RepID=A0ABQ8JIB5_DERPT|nr:hypothetical protein DERP_002631 [Dermatophagoides pteronyssinus]
MFVMNKVQLTVNHVYQIKIFAIFQRYNELGEQSLVICFVISDSIRNIGYKNVRFLSSKISAIRSLLRSGSGTICIRLIFDSQYNQQHIFFNDDKNIESSTICSDFILFNSLLVSSRSCSDLPIFIRIIDKRHSSKFDVAPFPQHYFEGHLFGEESTVEKKIKSKNQSNRHFPSSKLTLFFLKSITSNNINLILFIRSKY